MRRIYLFVFFIILSLGILIIFPIQGRSSYVSGYQLSRNSLGPDAQGGYINLPGAKIGKHTVLVMFIEFSNYLHKNNISVLLNNASYTDSYYREVSYNKFWLDIWYIQQWIQLNKTREYYGGDSGGQIDVNRMDFIMDSLKAADPHIDFKKYDYVIIFHAGGDQASSNDPNDLWSMASIGKWYFNLDGGVYLGIIVVSEDDPVGVITHELGHNLGLPDLYDYNNKEIFVGPWSLMATGSWLSPPSSITSPEKRWLGWIADSNLTILNKDQFFFGKLYALEAPGDILGVKISLGRYYYMLEYRRRVGTDKALPEEGLLLTWINESEQSGHGVIRVIDGSPSTPTINDAPLHVGDLYVDMINDFYIRIKSSTNNYLVIEAENGIPDLYVNDINWTSLGSNYTLSVIVRDGGGPVTSFDVALYVDNSYYATRSFNGFLGRGDSVSIQFELSGLGEGAHSVKAVVNPGREVVERDYSNNEFMRFISVRAYNYILDKYVVSDDRADVGSTQYIQMHFMNYSNGLDYSNSLVWLNGTSYTTNVTGWVTISFSSDEVGMYIFAISDDNGLQYATPTIIFDRVIINFSFVDRRIDVGETAIFDSYAYYEFDGRPFDGDFTLNDSLSKDIVGKFWYRVASISDSLYHLTVFKSNVDYVIFDRVKISLHPNAERFDVGEEASINIEAFYEYDGGRFVGEVSLNDSLLKDKVGKYAFTVASINDSLYGLRAFESNVAMIIFDVVNITLDADALRVDVGSNASITIYAVYAYDGSPFQGDVYLNDSLTHDKVGMYSYTVERIVDKRFGLTKFVSNTIDIIFDEVVIDLEARYNRVEVGKNATILFVGTYAYDNSPFDGDVYLNGSLKQDTLGKYTYIVVDIDDHRYGLHKFVSNSVSIIFDKLLLDVDVETLIPFNYKVVVKIYSQFEDGYVNGRVSVNGETAKYDPREKSYSRILLSPIPFESIKVEADVGSISLSHVETSIGIGTLILYFTIILLLLFVGLFRHRIGGSKN